MKKVTLGIAGILAMVSSANAVDTAQIKAACQSSDKTLWVERSQVCIPRNPCDNQKYGKYCNRVFAEYQSPADTNVYIDLINLYAKTHGLECDAVPQESALIGQDYVICQGIDVMVFEFNDINDHAWYWHEPERNFVKAFCVASDGMMQDDTCVSSKNNCFSAEAMLSKFDSSFKVLKTDDCSLTVDRDSIIKARQAAETLADYNSK